jgi:hypothetical protein
MCSALKIRTLFLLMVKLQHNTLPMKLNKLPRQPLTSSNKEGFPN